MADQNVTRRLTAILATDVVSYSRLMGADEAGTIDRLKTLRRELLDPKTAEHNGSIVKTTGDGGRRRIDRGVAGPGSRRREQVHGAGRYHALCAEVLESLLLEPGAAVIEVGGSLVLDDTAYGLLREHSRVVWLQATPEAHLERVQAQGDMRPMAGRDDALGELRQIPQDRSPLYGLAHQHVDTEAEGLEGSIQAVVDLGSR